MRMTRMTPLLAPLYPPIDLYPTNQSRHIVVNVVERVSYGFDSYSRKLKEQKSPLSPIWSKNPEQVAFRLQTAPNLQQLFPQD